MSKNTRYALLGTALAYYDQRTGEITFDESSLQRSKGPAISGDFAGLDDTGDDEFGDDEFGDDGDEFGDDGDFGDDDFGDDEFGDDEFGDDEGPSTGDFRDNQNRTRNKRNRTNRRSRRNNRNRQSGQSQTPTARGQQMNKSHSHLKRSTLSGQVTLTAAGQAVVTIRPQHDFDADDITFEGSAAGTTIASIQFGDVPVWTASGTGVPIAVFGAAGRLRNVLKGNKIKAGLDITITGNLTGAGTIYATLFGTKRK